MLTKIFSLLKYCYENSMKEQFPGIEFQLFLIASKSLLPYEDKIGCMIDVNRYKEEIDILNYYKNGNDEVVDTYIKNRNTGNVEDKLMEFKILPVLIADTDWDMAVDEALKIETIFTLNCFTLIDLILVSSVTVQYLSNDDIALDDIIIMTKDRLIQFSLKEFCEKNSMQLDKKTYIQFEKERIKILSEDEIFTQDRLKKFQILKYIFNKEKAKAEMNNETEAVLNNFTQYLYKLRKGLINPEKLKVPHNIPDFKEFLNYNKFNHPLLGKCIVVKRNNREVVLRNKSGLFKVNI